jgi:hypothetical protein
MNFPVLILIYAICLTVRGQGIPVPITANEPAIIQGSHNLTSWVNFGVTSGSNNEFRVIGSQPNECFRGIATNAPFTITWDASDDTNAVGYMIFVGAASHAYTQTAIVSGWATTNTTVIVRNVAPTNYFVMAALGDNNDVIGYSPEVSASPKPLILSLSQQ